MRKLTLKIEQDSEPFSPRDFDNLGVMICFHGRYELGDKHSLSIQEAKDLMAKMYDERNGVCLPIYLLDHSGLSISTSNAYPFNDRWDAGKVGFIYADKESIRKNFSIKAVSQKRLEQVRQTLLSEVKTYNQYLTGDVYGYVLKDETGEVIDSCSGYYGEAEALEAGKESMISNMNWEKKQETETQAIMAL